MIKQKRTDRFHVMKPFDPPVAASGVLRCKAKLLGGNDLGADSANALCSGPDDLADFEKKWRGTIGTELCKVHATGIGQRAHALPLYFFLVTIRSTHCIFFPAVAEFFVRPNMFQAMPLCTGPLATSFAVEETIGRNSNSQITARLNGIPQDRPTEERGCVPRAAR